MDHTTMSAGRRDAAEVPADPDAGDSGDDDNGDAWDTYDAGDPDEDTWDDRPPEELDDQRDREELRRRYYGLLQELRVLLPGVQVLVAFLLTAPFAQRFSELDSIETKVYAVALMSGVLAVVAFVAPTAFHRVGWRRSRSKRLQWSIRMLRVGLVFMALAFEAALFVVLGLLFSRTAALIGVGVIGVLGFVAWVVLPHLGQPSTGERD